MLPSSSTLFMLLAILLLQTSAFHLPPDGPPTSPSDCYATSTIPSASPNDNSVQPPASPTISATTASSTTTQTTASYPAPPLLPPPPPPPPPAPPSPPPRLPAAAPPPPHLRCLGPTRHDLFFAHADLPRLTFNIHTPWTLTYPSRLAAALRARNYTVATTPPLHRTCNWRALDAVSHQLVRRGTLSRTVGFAEGGGRGRGAASDYGGVGALAGNVEEVGRVMRETYPVVEVMLILVFTLWPVYVTVIFGVVACVAMWFCGRRA